MPIRTSTTIIYLGNFKITKNKKFKNVYFDNFLTLINKIKNKNDIVLLLLRLYNNFDALAYNNSSIDDTKRAV